jgi:hypothetical protein
MYSLTHIKYSQRALLQAVSFPIAECKRNGIEATQTADNKTNPTVVHEFSGRFSITPSFVRFVDCMLAQVFLRRSIFSDNTDAENSSS